MGFWILSTASYAGKDTFWVHLIWLEQRTGGYFNASSNRMNCP